VRACGPIRRTGWVRIMPLAAEGKPDGRRAVDGGQWAAGSGQWIVVGSVLGDVVTGGDTPQSRRAMSRQQAAADT
jgi:hypothetical protein